MYFRLSEGCFLVKGAKRGALYNLGDGSVYSIDPTSVRLLEALERGGSVGEIRRDFPEASAEQILEYLQKLEAEKLGRYSPTSIELTKPSLHYEHGTLDFVWVELREDCNLRCRHCYAGATGEKIPGRLTGPEWVRVMSEAKGIGCKALQFIGGEPFLFGEEIFELARQARDLGYETVEIFSNLTVMKPEWVARIKELGITMAVSLYAKDPAVHDDVTRRKGSHAKMMKSIALIRENGIPLRYCVTVMKHNEAVVEETMAFLKELGDEYPSYDIVRPSGRGSDKELIPERLASSRMMKEASFPPVKQETFLRRHGGNACWQGKIAVKSNGDVMPCIMQRDDPAGNVRTQPLREVIFGEGLQRYWKLSLDHIKTCRDCEYRYACHDCRSACHGASGDLLAKPPHCQYNPYEGIFEDTTVSVLT